MSALPVTVAVEGTTDLAVVEQLLRFCGLSIGQVFVTDGKGKLDARLAGFNNAARFACWFVLRDLDRDAECPPQLLAEILPAPAKGMCCRVAVHAMEAWLLADREAIARFLGVETDLVPAAAEALPDPKKSLVDLARKSCRKAVREDMIPRPGTTAKVGPRYSARIIEYTADLWRPDEAARRSASLGRCLAALRRCQQSS